MFASFDDFLNAAPADRPFCFWFGSRDPHRPYDRALASSYGMDARDVTVPAYLPDAPEVRRDLMDYCAEVLRFDRAFGAILTSLDASGRADNTLVLVTTDNGMPFPRAKANLYDAGTRVPLVIRFPGVVAPGQTSDALVSHLDLAPMFLALAGVAPPPEVAGEGLTGLLSGTGQGERIEVFLERERHARARTNNVSYPIRAIRTDRYLLIRNITPERWPAGDPRDYVIEDNPFADIDAGPSKTFLIWNRQTQEYCRYFGLACDKRPEIELYDVVADLFQMNNLADEPEHAATCEELNARLTAWMVVTGDPRAPGAGEEFDFYPYYGRPVNPT